MRVSHPQPLWNNPASGVQACILSTEPRREDGWDRELGAIRRAPEAPVVQQGVCSHGPMIRAVPRIVQLLKGESDTRDFVKCFFNISLGLTDSRLFSKPF